MEKISSLMVLDDDQENHKLASKLPRWTLVRWERRVYDWKEKNHNFPPFSEFVKYLVTESNIACDPVISRFKEDDSKKAKGRPRNILATRSEEGDQSKERPNGEAKQTTCILCNRPHELNSCQSFCAKDIIDRKEFLYSLQQRQKWVRLRRNMQPGDIVLMSEGNVPRNCWRMARIEEAYTDEDGFVRKVKLVMSDPSLNRKGERIRAKSVLERPIQKLVLLLKCNGDQSENEDKRFPDGEPN
ncbi:Hypothetical predicted protein [Paramuricea clavata]|uniref:DUF5641 domain-containing protein n=1 Tax=Paramuricea clavata TaxID=317549 RepID=A0A6S7JPS7_PARCT|nr:Hypothetical predicted protein [Paramuricea clavata]